MWSRLICLTFLFFCGCVCAQAQSRWRGCLLDGVKANEVVSVVPVVSVNTSKPGKQTTVRQRLTQIKARCRRGKLVDARGRQIRFYRLDGCWGYPPPDYRERMERQSKNLSELKRRYTVIEMTCNPSGIPIP